MIWVIQGISDVPKHIIRKVWIRNFKLKSWYGIYEPYPLLKIIVLFIQSLLVTGCQIQQHEKEERKDPLSIYHFAAKSCGLNA